MSRGIAIIGGIAAALVVLGLAYFFLFSGDATDPALTEDAVSATGSGDTAAAPETAQPEPEAPTFDIVRVERDGQTVAAGRAEPGSKVRLIDNGTVIAEAEADSRGEWVIVLDEPLETGDRQLRLEAELPDGTLLNSEQVVSISVPVDPNAEALVVLQKPDQPSQVLQGTGVVAEGGTLTLDTVDYGEDGAVIFSGRAPSDANVRIYVDNAAAGDATADAKGRWVVTATIPIEPGVHELRVDQLDAQGLVLARLEAPFERATAEEVAMVLQDGKVVIQPGNNLWTIAQKLYGSGYQYTVIYQANKSQIRDPNLIYPGQVFETPGTGG
ncbi:MAG: Ig-like domain-containing protein [Candidatus Phaeomarinobacter sp.]